MENLMGYMYPKEAHVLSTLNKINKKKRFNNI